ncbi:unnamed protein product [Amoebophrya sp. A25]|nr:unnamed protein product [Amoebophrya sp. A25]|eukprot:GSA25T00006208001.1
MGCGSSSSSSGARSAMARRPDEDEELVEVSLLDAEGELLDWVTARVLERHYDATKAASTTSGLRKKRVFVLPTAAAVAHGFPDGTELMVDERRIRAKMPDAYLDNEFPSGGEDSSLFNNHSSAIGHKTSKSRKRGSTSGTSSTQGTKQHLSAPSHTVDKNRNKSAVMQDIDSELQQLGDEAAASRDPFGRSGDVLRETVAMLLDDVTHIKAAKRMAKELRANCADDGGKRSEAKAVAAFIPMPVRLFEWRIALKAPDQTPYARSVFYLHCNFCNTASGESKYPFEPPKINFATPIFHPNVSQRGKICLNTLNDKAEWSPLMGVEMLCVAVSALMQQPNCNDPLNTHASGLLLKNPAEFKRKAREFTRKHAVLDADFVDYALGRENLYVATSSLAEEDDVVAASIRSAVGVSPTPLRNGAARGGLGAGAGAPSLIDKPAIAAHRYSPNPLFQVGSSSSCSSKPRAEAEDDSLVSILDSRRGKASNKGVSRMPIGDESHGSTSAAGLLHTDQFADYQMNSAGRALDEREAQRRIRWNAALEKYRADRDGGAGARV